MMASLRKANASQFPSLNEGNLASVLPIDEQQARTYVRPQEVDPEVVLHLDGVPRSNPSPLFTRAPTFAERTLSGTLMRVQVYQARVASFLSMYNEDRQRDAND
eukprot:UN15362